MAETAMQHCRGLRTTAPRSTAAAHLQLVARLLHLALLRRLHGQLGQQRQRGRPVSRPEQRTLGVR